MTASEGPPYDIEIVRVDPSEGLASDPSADWAIEQGLPGPKPLRGIRLWSRATPAGRSYRYRFDYLGEAVEFQFEPDGRVVRVAWTEQVSELDVAALISGPVLGRALRLRGVYCLHATTVRIQQHAVSLLGPSGAGKSTFAAALLDAGGDLLSDDQTTYVMKGTEVHAFPGQRGLRLWHDSVRHLRPPAGSVRRLWPGIEDLERFLVDVPTEAGKGSMESTPVVGAYLLMPRKSVGGEIEVAELPPAERVAVLCSNVYGGMEPSREVRIRELAFFSQVASRVGVGRLTLPQGLDRIGDAAKAFVERVHRVVA